MLGVTFKRTIVVSAVGVRDGASLLVLSQCLEALSRLARDGKTRVVACVTDRTLCEFPGIEYREYPDVLPGTRAYREWLRRGLYWESVLIAEQDDKPVDLLLSLFDATPRAEARCRVLFCRNPFPGLKLRPRDFAMDRNVPKAVREGRRTLRKRVRQNDYLIVQQDAFRRSVARWLHFDPAKIIVCPPSGEVAVPPSAELPLQDSRYTFFCPSDAACYKNFEQVCEAARLLELEIGRRRFRLVCTVRGEDNKYGWWLKSQWDHVDSIHFIGYQNPSKLRGWYERADCLVYPSRAESWGRPISEFAPTGKPMLLVDLPYAHETAAGAQKVSFFPLNDPLALKEQMKALVSGREDALSAAPYHSVEAPKAYDWDELLAQLLPPEE